MKKSTVIYIVRHGRTDWNDKHLVQGHSDIELNLEGKETAKKLAKEFKKIKFDVVYSSDLLRAKQTAEIVALEQKLGIQTSANFRERSFGNIEGKPHTALKEVDEILEKLDEEVRFSYKFKNNLEMESDKQVYDRMLAFLKQIVIKDNGKNILIVTHGGPIRILLQKLHLLNYKDWYEINNLAFIVLKSDGQEFEIIETSGIEKRKK